MRPCCEAVIAKWCTDFRKCGAAEELRRLNDKKVHALNPEFFKHVNSKYSR